MFGDNEGDSGAGDVVSLGKEHGQVAMAATATRGGDSTRVCEQLPFEKLKRGVGWFTHNGGEGFEGEAELRWGGSHNGTGGRSRRTR